MSKKKYIIWHVEGGLGKNIVATSLCKDLKEKYLDRKLILVVSHPEVFLNNPHIDRVYHLGNTPHFYTDYIKDKDTIVFRHEPYNESGHIIQKDHLIKSWCYILGLKFKNQKPDAYINYTQSMSLKLWDRPKPILLLHTNGGPADVQVTPYSWCRDMPIELAEGIIKKYSNQYHIIQVTRPNGYQLEGVERVDQPLNNFDLFALVVVAQKRILIDSCLQHAAASFNKPSTVFWIGTSPTQFGYKIHKNIVANEPKLANQRLSSYLYSSGFANLDHQCPYLNVREMFDIDDIILNQV